MGMLFMPKSLAAALLLILVFLTSACNKVTEPSKNKQEDFSGTLQPGGSQSWAFTVSNGGEYEVTLIALSPVQNTFLGTGFGQLQSNSACQPSGFPNNFSQLNVPSLGGPISKGRWCVYVFDPGSLTATESYTVRVSHP